MNSIAIRNNERTSGFAERFIKTVKNKIYKHVAAISRILVHKGPSFIVRFCPNVLLLLFFHMS